MQFFKRFFQQSPNSSNQWCMTYMDSNSFRRARVTDILKDSGIEVIPSTDHILVKKDQHVQALNVLRSHGY